MDIKVDVDKDAINAAVTKAILESAIEEEMQKAIQESIKTVSRSYDDTIYRIVTVEHREFLEAEVRKQITEEVISDISRKAFNTFVNKY